jgi:predicted butyrate kinase (DUF1464 family)
MSTEFAQNFVVMNGKIIDGVPGGATSFSRKQEAVFVVSVGNDQSDKGGNN